MIRKWKLLLVGVSCVMGTAMAQNNPILLFPKGAPGETTKLIERQMLTVGRPEARRFFVSRM